MRPSPDDLPRARRHIQGSANVANHAIVTADLTICGVGSCGANGRRHDGSNGSSIVSKTACATRSCPIGFKCKRSNAKKAGMFVVGLDGESDDIISNMKVATEPLMIIVGSEGKGLARLTKEKCDLVVSIPISATTESLNASVATSIALFHVDQQRRAQ